MLADDCKLSLVQFYGGSEKNSWETYPRPYSMVSDYYDMSESYRIHFPKDVTINTREDQYYILARYLNNGQFSRIGLIAYLEIEVPHNPNIDEKFWGRNARVAGGYPCGVHAKAAPRCARRRGDTRGPRAACVR